MDINKIAMAPTAWSVVASATAATVTATKAAITHATNIVPAQRHCVTGFSISASATVSTISTFQIKNGTTVVFQYELGTGFSGILNVELTRPFICDQATAVVGTATTLGTGVVCTVVVRGMTVSD